MNRLTMITGALLAVLAAGCASTGGGGYYQSAPYQNYGYHYASGQPQYGSTLQGNVLPAQAAGALAGGLLGAQFGSGNGRLAAAALGATAGAYGVGKFADPCQPDLNLGHALGALAGGLLGSQFGRGRGNVAATALGATTGALVGGNLRATPNPNCR